MKQENKSKVKKMEEWHDVEKKTKMKFEKKKMGNLNAQRRRRERKQEKP